MVRKLLHDIKRKEDLLFIVNSNGRVAQCLKYAEEAGELTRAVAKYMSSVPVSILITLKKKWPMSM